MLYDDVVAGLFDEAPEGPAPGPTVQASTARRLRDAIEPIAMHSVWSRGVNERLASQGFNFMTSYVGSRAALLGSPDPGVVVSSFAVFEPSMLTGSYEAAAALWEPSELLAARDDATIASLSSAMADANESEVAEVADVLAEAVVAADGTGRPLFSGLRSLGMPDSPIGKLWRSTELAREHRGDSHVAVCVANGLDPIEMNVLTELWVGMPMASYSASRAWSAEQLEGAASRLSDRGFLENGSLSAAGKTFRDGIETQTDQLEQSIVDALGSAADSAIDHLNEWSAMCIAAKSFPTDHFKRAAG